MLMLDSLEIHERPDLPYLEDLSPRCKPLYRRAVVSLDKQTQELQTNRHLVDEALSDLLRFIQKDVLECTTLRVQKRLENCLKDYVVTGRLLVEPSALSFLASQADFLGSAERMALALNAYLKIDKQTIDSITIRAPRDVELERTTLTIILSLPVKEVDVMLDFRGRLCDYLDSVLSDEDKLRTTVSVTRAV
jgi:hypothetical protein